jgi:hypothetical protein
LQRYHLIPGSSAPAYPQIQNVRYFSADMKIKRRVKDVTRERENLVCYSKKEVDKASAVLVFTHWMMRWSDTALRPLTNSTRNTPKL